MRSIGMKKFAKIPPAPALHRHCQCNISMRELLHFKQKWKHIYLLPIENRILIFEQCLRTIRSIFVLALQVFLSNIIPLRHICTILELDRVSSNICFQNETLKFFDIWQQGRNFFLFFFFFFKSLFLPTRLILILNLHDIFTFETILRPPMQSCRFR